MTREENEDIYQFLAGNWYDRPEDDATIVKEIVAEESPVYGATCIQLLHKFLDSSEVAENKANVVRKAAWRSFPERAEAPLHWLAEMVALLEQASFK